MQVLAYGGLRQVARGVQVGRDVTCGYRRGDYVVATSNAANALGVIDLFQQRVYLGRSVGDSSVGTGLRYQHTTRSVCFLLFRYFFGFLRLFIFRLHQVLQRTRSTPYQDIGVYGLSVNVPLGVLVAYDRAVVVKISVYVARISQIVTFS